MRANRDTVHAYAYARVREHLKEIHERAKNDEQAQEITDHGKCQEANEKSFCLGMLVGGAVALTVLVVTLKLLGVI